MLAFWGLTGLSNTSVDFTGLPDYASTMTFELRRPSNATGFNDLFVRFGFRNGSLPSAPLNNFPMFGKSDIDMPWSTWSQSMANISISSDKVWCNLCASPLGFCSGYATSSGSATAGGSGNGNTTSTSGGATASNNSSIGLSNAAAGGIGAGVTIGVIALIEGIAALLYFRNRKGRSTAGRSSGRNLAHEKAPSDITNGSA
jgi:prostatic aicd phosphatase